MSVCLLYLIGDEAPPAARDSCEGPRALNRRCYPHTGNGRHNWCLSSSQSLSVGFSIQDEAMNVGRPEPLGDHNLPLYLTHHSFTFSLDSTLKSLECVTRVPLFLHSQGDLECYIIWLLISNFKETVLLYI